MADPIDGETMADAHRSDYPQHVVLATEAADAATLWTIFTHVHDAARFSPVLGIVSPSPECGKTTLLSTVGLMVPKPLWANNITAAAVFRSVEQWQPCLLIDEADTFLSDNEELRGVLNSGHNRDAAFVIRTTGDDHEPRQFRTWCPKAIALIGKLPPTLISRAILIELRRLGVTEHVEPLDDLRDHVLTLGRQCARWALDHIDEIRKAKPPMPPSLRGRRADNWKTMIAIADAIGGEWPERARRAAPGARLLVAARNPPASNCSPTSRPDLRRPAERQRGPHRRRSSRRWWRWRIGRGPNGRHGKPLTAAPTGQAARAVQGQTARTAITHGMIDRDAEGLSPRRLSPTPSLAMLLDTPPSHPPHRHKRRNPPFPSPFHPSQSNNDVTDENGRKAAENRQCDGCDG